MLLSLAEASSAPPHIFFSDLESGPATGGEKNAGAFVTIYGARFGAARGASTVTVGGGAVAAYPAWSDSKITFQLGRLAVTGPIVVKTAAGTSNSDIVFIVRKEGSCGPSQDKECLYFVSAHGKEGGKGTFASPWATVPYAVQHVPEGGIIYTSMSQPGDDGQGWKSALTLRNSWCGAGKDGFSRALVAYPGATVTIGAVDGPDSGIRATDHSAGEGACSGHWTFAGLQLRGAASALILNGTSYANPSSAWRIVGNDMTCPNGDGASACWETSLATGVQAYGNNIHDTGKAAASALYHGVYFSTDSNQIDFGWNTIANVHGCRGLQFYSTNLDAQSGYDLHDLKIHDNVIHDTQCDGIVINTVDPSKGSVRIFNNLIYDAGKGPNNPEHSGNWACIYIAGDTNTGAKGSGSVEIEHNTLVNCGTFPSPPYWDGRAGVKNGGQNSALKINLRNNIIVEPKDVAYVICGQKWGCSGVYGSNNLFFGNGSAPGGDIANSINKDPMFVNAGQKDFRLSTGSGARGAGVGGNVNSDKDGIDRNAHRDLGALQFVEP